MRRSKRGDDVWRFCVAAGGLLLLVTGSLSSHAPSASGSSADPHLYRLLKAQEALERFYYSKRVGARQPFESAVSPHIIERKVRTSLRLSVALEQLWKTPITQATLQRELERIARDTRMPERLQGLYDALGNDAGLAREILARPTLVRYGPVRGRPGRLSRRPRAPGGGGGQHQRGGRGFQR